LRGKILAVLLVLVMLGSIVSPAVAKAELRKEQIKIDVKENSKTSTVVQ